MKKENKKNSINISNVLVVTPPRASAVGIEKWQSLMNTAYRGRRASYYDFIDNLLIDLVLSDAVDKRVRAITNSEILFQKDKKDVEAMMDFIDTPEFENLVKEFLLTKFYGKTVIELNWIDGKFKPYIIPRQHLDTAKKVILKNRFEEEGWSYVDNDFIINLGDDLDLGLFNKTAPWTIWKRNGGADFAQYSEQYGIPQMIGLYDPDDENGRTEMESAFQNRGSGGSMTMSKNSDVKTLGEGASGNTTIHKTFLDTCDEQILIGVSSQTMTTKDGSSYSQGQVHADTEDNLNQADRRYIQRILNTELLPRLEKRGYPVKGGKFVFAEKGENLSKKEQLEIAKTVDSLTESGVADEYFFETFGLPKGKGKERKIPTVDSKERFNEDDFKKGKKNAKKTKLSAKKLSYFNQFLNFFANAPQ